MTSEIVQSPQSPVETVKRKRGRPASVMPIELYAMYSTVMVTVATRRGMRNKVYEIKAGIFLQAMQKRSISEIDYLLSFNRHQQFRCMGIHRELGRITDQSLFERVALTICECEKQRHRTVREYEKLLRYCRLKGITDDLPLVITETVSLNHWLLKIIAGKGGRNGRNG